MVQLFSLGPIAWGPRLPRAVAGATRRRPLTVRRANCLQFFQTITLYDSPAN